MARVRTSRARGFLLAATASALAFAGPAAASAAEPTASAASDAASVGRYIVRYEAEPGKASRGEIKRLGGKVRQELRLIDGLAVDLTAAQLRTLRADPSVESVEADGTLVAFDHSASTGDLEYENAWGVEHIGSREVHLAGNTGQGVKLAIIDTGIDYIHDDPDDVPYVVDPEFPGIYKGGYDFFNNDVDPYDDNGHGTHVAGIAAAVHNGYLVTGVAPGVDLYALKVLSATGEGEYSGLIAALGWAVDHDMDVVNMSLGGHEASDALAAAIANAYDAGVTLVAASGNAVTIQDLIYGCPVAYPAAYDQVIAVSFTNQQDKLTGFSCTGTQMDFAAPGDGIFSPVPVGPTGSCMFCTPQGYSAQSGTSMASPHVAGVAALTLHAGIADGNGNGLVADDLKAHLCANTSPANLSPTDPKYAKFYGCGIVDADKALVDNPPPPADGPVAADDAATVVEDGSSAIAVLANDSDPDGEALSVISATDPANGSASVLADDTIQYTPDPDYAGPDTFDYRIANASGQEATGSVSVTVSPVNDDPVAVDDSASTLFDASADIDVLANDSDVDGDGLSVSGVGNPAHGTAVVDVNGTVTYQPGAGYTGDDAFDYQITDGAGGSATATVSVTVLASNDPPDAVDDAVATPEDAVASIDVVANDADPDGGAVTVVSVTQPSHGSTSIAENGEVVYAPAADYHGSDSFTYAIRDPLGLTDAATVSLEVTPVNDAPTAANDTSSTSEDAPVTIDVLANDSDIDGDTLSVTAVSTPGSGTATIEADGRVTYTPAADTSGADSFGYTVSDGAGGSDSGTVAVTISAVDDAPIAADKTVATAYQKAVSVTLTGTDAETCNLTFQIVTPPDRGTLTTPSSIACISLTSPYSDSSKVTYTPASGYSGPDAFAYRVSDGAQWSAPATVSISVAPPPKIHVGDIDQSRLNYAAKWTAIATVRVHTEAEAGRSGVTVTGTWSDGADATGTCKTTTGGCQVKLDLPKTTATVRFTVTSLTYAGHVYDPTANHDPESDSDGTTVVVIGPP